MKLAEALILRADYQRNIEQIKDRLLNNAKVQEGEEPSEKPEDILIELDCALNNLTDIIKRINNTNINTNLDSNRSLSDALADRDKLWSKRSALSNFYESLTITHDRYSKSEVKIVRTYNPAEIRKEIDMISKEHRELDTKIQGLNWTIDLI